MPRRPQQVLKWSTLSCCGPPSAHKQLYETIERLTQRGQHLQVNEKIGGRENRHRNAFE